MIAVQWHRFPPALQRFIDEEAAAGNVEALADYRDVWKRSKIKRRYKFPLVAYINRAQRQARRSRKAWNARLTA